jgi:hypothetical protein
MAELWEIKTPELEENGNEFGSDIRDIFTEYPKLFENFQKNLKENHKEIAPVLENLGNLMVGLSRNISQFIEKTKNESIETLPEVPKSLLERLNLIKRISNIEKLANEMDETSLFLQQTGEHLKENAPLILEANWSELESATGKSFKEYSSNLERSVARAIILGFLCSQYHNKFYEMKVRFEKDKWNKAMVSLAKTLPRREN